MVTVILKVEGNDWSSEQEFLDDIVELISKSTDLHILYEARDLDDATEDTTISQSPRVDDS